MPTIHDKEFGTVTVRRSKLAKNIRLSVAPNGTLRISMPMYAPLFLARRLLASSRQSITRLLSTQRQMEYQNGMTIGKSHRLEVVQADRLSIKTKGLTIRLELPAGRNLSDVIVRDTLRDAVLAALRKEARSYLPRRLDFLAERHDFNYQKLRLSHASTRWGSCSSSGTISLNIALMRLDFKLIDYVIIHELCHTAEMNHSTGFWRLVERADPEYRSHRKQLKAENPGGF